MLLTIALLAPCFLGDESTAKSNDPVAILRARMHSSSASERVDAAKALAKLAPENAAEPIWDNFKKGKFGERVAYAILLLELGHSEKDVLTIIDKALRDPRIKKDAEVEVDGVSLTPLADLGDLGEKVVPALPIILGSLQRSEDGVAGFEATAIADSKKGDNKAALEMARLLNRTADESGRIAYHRGLVIQSLGTMGPAAKVAIPTLEHELMNREARNQNKAAIALLEIQPGHKRAIDYLCEEASATGRFSGVLVAGMLSKSQVSSNDSLVVLKKLVENEDLSADGRAAACRALANVGAKASDLAQSLKPYLIDKNPRVRIPAAYAMIAANAKDSTMAIQALNEALGNTTTDDCFYATRYCDYFAPPPKALLFGLRKAIHHDWSSISTQAAKSILRIDSGDEETVKLMVRILREGVPRKPNDTIDPNPAAKYAASVNIAIAGPKAAAARPVLINLLRSTDGAMLTSVAIALRAIDSAESKKKPR